MRDSTAATRSVPKFVFVCIINYMYNCIYCIQATEVSLQNTALGTKLVDKDYVWSSNFIAQTVDFRYRQRHPGYCPVLHIIADLYLLYAERFRYTRYPPIHMLFLL